jgi:putative spermidine/putrescine transport system substrate-binding protein
LQLSFTRSTLFILFTGLIVLTLVGCGTGGGTGTSTSTTLTLYSSGDVNIQHLWNNTLIPAFEKAYPSINVHLIYSEHGTSNDTTFARISAAIAAKKDPGIDLLDDSTTVSEAAAAHLLLPLTTQQVPLLSHVDPDLLKPVDSMGLPYRASSVVLAYNTQYVQQPPKTLNDLLTWIKAHPGKFTYNTPASGGSGQGFVQSVLNANASADARQAFISGYDPSMESQWNAGFQQLKSLQPSIYRNGFYPNGNTAVLQLLANGSIWMAPVWSDMALNYLSQHLLPASVKLVQLNPPFDGGPAYIGIPRGTPHTQQAYTLLNWLLTSNVQAQIINAIQGFPGVEWSYVPANIRAQFASIAQSYSLGYSAKFVADMNKLWQSQVAGG